MKRMSWMGLLLLGLCLPLSAAMPEAVRAQLESSMLVTGRVEIEPDGSTRGVEIDQPDKLPPGVVELVRSTARQWQFEPVRVDGVAAAVRARMSVRVVARKTGEDEYSIGLRGATFGGSDKPQEGTEVTARHMSPPRYPEAAVSRGMQGVVFVVVRVGRDGRVSEAFPEQVNLTAYGTPREMDAARSMLSDAAMRAVRRWAFNPPTSGPLAAEPHWVVRIPVSFQLAYTKLARAKPAYGSWEVYVPGPRAPAPWVDTRAAAATDAIGDGQLVVEGSGPRLLTPVEG